MRTVVTFWKIEPLARQRPRHTPSFIVQVFVTGFYDDFKDVVFSLEEGLAVSTALASPAFFSSNPAVRRAWSSISCEARVLHSFIQ